MFHKKKERIIIFFYLLDNYRGQQFFTRSLRWGAFSRSFIVLSMLLSLHQHSILLYIPYNSLRKIWEVRKHGIQTESFLNQAMLMFCFTKCLSWKRKEKINKSQHLKNLHFKFSFWIFTVKHFIKSSWIMIQKKTIETNINSAVFVTEVITRSVRSNNTGHDKQCLNGKSWLKPLVLKLQSILHDL